jgi:dienelactone hydrolase
MAGSLSTRTSPAYSVAAANEKATLAQNFAEKFTTGDYAGAEAMFDSTMKAAVPEAALKEIWDQCVKRYGAFKKLGVTRSEKLDGYDSFLIEMQFTKSAFNLRLVLDSKNMIAGMQLVPIASTVVYKAPAYVKVRSFKETNVIIGKGAWALRGTLAMPAGKGPFPAVVLVHGSGPNDRDESIGPNKVFRDLAWGLATQGIAVLRYEKRTKEHAAEFTKMRNYTVKAETVDDAAAAAALLRNTKKINKNRVFVVGHSLGGMLAPRIAQADPKIKGMVILAGPTRPLEDLVLDQTKYILSLTTTDTVVWKQQVDLVQKSVAKIKSKSLTIKTPADQLLGLPASYWLDLRGYNPAVLAAKINKPMLLLQGERDYQVKMVDFKGWQKYLKCNKKTVFKSYPKLNHLFMEGVGKISTPDEYEKESHIPAYVIKDIANWVRHH